MSELTAWLAQRGLEKYASLFAENDVDLEVLKALSEDDLRELGLPLGARKKILQAIADADKAPSAAVSPQFGGSAPPRPGPERRQITVMFSDVVGSTALAEQVDVEDLRSLVLSYQQACGSVIAQYDGHIAQYLGDGVLAYFGYPHAHEDDPVRAVRAGLALIERMQDVNRRLVAEYGVALDIRVGVHTGLVVAGEMGTGATRERLAVGETPNVAARVQALADPGTVVVSDATWRLVDGFFTAQPLGSQILKGVSRPVPTYRVLGSTGLANPFEARLSRSLTPLISREVELESLAKRWEQTTEGEGQVVLVQGEAGIGKSRLMRAFRDRLVDVDHDVVALQCSAQHQSSALYPVIEYLTRALELRSDDGLPERQVRLRALMERLGAAADCFLPLATLLGILENEASSLLPSNPDQRRHLTFEALVQMMVSPIRERPVVLTIEDVHWIDPSTQDLIGNLIDAIRDRRVMIVLTARPEYRAPWVAVAHFAMLTVGRLSRRETEAMIRQVAGDALSTDVLAQLLSRSDGVPLFVEELTKTVMDANPDETGSVNTVPETLQDALTARLDRLAPVRELIQVAALLGRVFDCEVVREVTGLGPDQFDRALVDLADAGLVYRRPRLDRQAFEFKHALIQEAALSTLVRRQRALLHGRIAEALPRIHPDVVQQQPELVAHHLQEAGGDRVALDLWRAAGELAAQRSASAEAAGHFRSAAACLRRIGVGAVRPEDEAAIHLSLATSLMQAEGYRARGLEAAVEAAERAATAADSLSLRCRVALQTAPVFYGTGRNGDYLRMVDLLVDRASNDLSPVLHGSLLITRGIAYFNRGELLKADGDFQAARKILPLSMRFDGDRVGGGDAAMVAGYYAAATLRSLGRLQEAHVLEVSSEARARQLEDPFSLAWALHGRSHSYSTLGQHKAAIVDADECITISRRYGFSPRLAFGLFSRGMARAGLGELAMAIEDCREALAIWAKPGVVFSTPLIVSALAGLFVRTGRSREARTILDDVDARIAGTDEASSLAECQRVRAMIALDERDVSGAAQWLEAAVATSRAQAARLQELRATTMLAEVLAMQGRQSEAYRVLSDVYGWFTEGHRGPALRNAKALLDRLKE